MISQEGLKEKREVSDIKLLDTSARIVYVIWIHGPVMLLHCVPVDHGS